MGFFSMPIRGAFSRGGLDDAPAHLNGDRAAVRPAAQRRVITLVRIQPLAHRYTRRALCPHDALNDVRGYRIPQTNACGQ